jgi:hypothetical protein
MGTTINDAGDIAGVYLTTPNVAHGFVRAVVNGLPAFTTFDAPNAGTGLNQGTFPAGINIGGDIAGMYFDANNAYHGFLRVAAGTITEFDVPGAPTTIGHRGTNPLGINTAGDITGFYVDANAVRHGFVRARNGTFTTFDAPGAGSSPTEGTVPFSIDTAGDVTGFYKDSGGTFHGFVRAANGTISGPIDAPGAGTGPGGKVSFMGTLPLRFDAAGDIGGTYADTGGLNHGFVYMAGSATPTFTTFDVPGAGSTGFLAGTVALGMNAGGDISGLYTDTNGSRHGFTRTANGAITAPIDAPGAATTGMLSGTVLISINTLDDVTGTFADVNGVFHGFVLTRASVGPPAAATPTFSPPAGTYSTPQLVTISDTTPGATIHYTTDNTTPTTSSPVFNTAIAVNSTETIQAIAAANGFSNSAVASATYIIIPAITSISPTNTIAGGPAFTLTVNGTGFVSTSVVNFGANARVTSFLSSTQLSAIILASDITTAGNFNVTVTNPAQSSGTSNSASFTVLTPQQATAAIVNSVNALFSQGVLNGGQDNSLMTQLQHAINMMNAGKNAGAIGNLDSFISEVNDLLSSGVLSPSQAASLISAAQSVIARLS